MIIERVPGRSMKMEVIFTEPHESVDDLYDAICQRFITPDPRKSPCQITVGDFYLMGNDGKLLAKDEQLLKMRESAEAEGSNSIYVDMCMRVLGGKGGFGSMLRAIGAQIEKTTNRDACRDLSGRRLRDINEEQRLKKWYAKQKEREQARLEAKKQKLDKLKQFADGTTVAKIDDQEYLKSREDTEESVYQAVDQASSIPEKEKEKPKPKATKRTMLDEEFSDSTSDEDSQEDEGSAAKKKKLD